ncbi:MarR family transcriptional regulator [Streptomonospora sp. S1-112]|uniref:MarR family transcriptional regulator n=1 Tax=Streptomonospora mangrovi TaxID=2883123 RepID=A0A9X3NQG6_9ACTN|nr:MarR family transcriptional regulator [Streptomonospora mangrovi]MDA0567653.1 MarR family transcriptional regulator [Streptomonospora mangrovi]
MDTAPGEDAPGTGPAPRPRGELYTAIRGDGQRLAAGLIRLLHAMSAESDLNPTDFQCFALLRVGGPMTPGEIAQSLRLTTGSVTVVVDRLAERGLVRRDRHPEDRRKVVVRLAEGAAGAGVHGGGVPMGLAEAMTALHGRYSEAELEIIDDWLARAGAVLTEVAAGIGGERRRARRRPEGPASA